MNSNRRRNFRLSEKSCEMPKGTCVNYASIFPSKLYAAKLLYVTVYTCSMEKVEVGVKLLSIAVFDVDKNAIPSLLSETL